MQRVGASLSALGLRPLCPNGETEGRMLRLLRSPGTDSKAEAPATDPLLCLAHRAAQGEGAATTTLVCSVGPPVLRVVRGVLGASHPDVEDVCQDALLAFLAALPRFREQCSIVHFACRVAALRALSARRRAACRRTEVLEEELVTDEGSSVERTRAMECRRAVRDLLDELPEAQAEALVLHLVAGYTVEEVASAAGVPLNTMRSRLRRASATLRSRIGSESRLREVAELP